jgi:hypothetical protein
LESIEKCLDKEQRHVFLAELACYKARIGDFDEAEKFRIELRREFDDGRSLRVSILIMCVEALMLYYRELSVDARDRMARANLLSTAAREHRLTAFTSSWLAHIDFNLNRFDAMAKELDAVFQTIHADDGTAECRVALVLGDAFLIVGNSIASQGWYECARRAAIRTGDQAAVGAITYNRAALRVAATRLASIDDLANDDAIAMARAEVQTAINYQAVAQLRSLDHLLQTASAGVLILQERYAEAEVAIGNLLRTGDVPMGTGQWLLLDADRNLALSQIGRLAEATDGILQTPESSILTRTADDRALIFASLARAAGACGNRNLESRYLALSSGAMQEHTELVQTIRLKIDRYEKCELNPK